MMSRSGGRPLTHRVTVAAAVFTLRDRDLLIALRRSDGALTLPEVDLPSGRDLAEIAESVVAQVTGIDSFFVQQLYTVNTAAEAPAGITVAYLALVSGDKLRPGNPGADVAEWHSAYRLPELTQSQRGIIDDALTRLRYKIEYSAVAFELLPDAFTLSELLKAYMVILNDFRLDKANFRKKIREAGILEEVSGFRETGGRPAKLFRFREDAQLETKARRIFP